MIPLPHATHRLRLDDPYRVALFARRFAPDACIALDYGGRIDEPRPGDADGGAGDGDAADHRGAGWRPTGAASVLGVDGRVIGSPAPELGYRVPLRFVSAPFDAGPATRKRPAAPNAAAVVERLRSAARLGDAAVDAAIASMEIPVVGDGWALLIHRGPADEVRFQHWLSGLPADPPFERLPGTDLWILKIEIQDRARIEYKLEIVNGTHRELVRDPLNPSVANDPFGGNSVVQAIGYTTPLWTQEQDTSRRGTVHRGALASAVFGDDRPYSIYLPARFRTTRRYPLLIVHDGLDYLHYANLVPVLDNLIHRLEIPPMVAALIPSSDRTTEYVANERHARFIVDDLVPTLERELPLLDGPQDRGLMGASLGGVAALHTAWSHPGAFGKLLLQSGSFAFTDIGDHDLGPIFDPVVSFVNRFRKDPGVRPIASSCRPASTSP